MKSLCLAIAVSLVGLICVARWNLRLFYVATGSMAPAIPARALVLVAAYRNKSVQVGDVAAFRRDGNDQVVIHRVVQKVNASTYMTSGDANLHVDPYRLITSQILGYVVVVMELGEW